MSADNIDPGAVHSLSGELLEFMRQRAGLSQEVQVAALRVAAATIDESILAYNAAVNRDSMRKFFKGR